MWRISFIFFALSAIINGDPADLTAVLQNNNELNINDNTENALINDENIDDINEAENIEKALTNPEHICDANEDVKSKIRTEFTAKMCEKLKKKIDVTVNDKIEKRAINKIQINHVIDVLVNNKNKVKGYYNLRDAYAIKEICGQNYLFDKEPAHTNGGRIVALEDMFDVCVKVHKDCGHQGREAMLKEADKFYGNVTRPIVELYLDYSQEYQIKRVNRKNNALIAKPIRSSEFNSRWQVDLVDFRTLPDGEFKWIMTVQDHFTKYTWLRPLKNKCGLEVAKGLMEIFGDFGAPFILQSI